MLILCGYSHYPHTITVVPENALASLPHKEKEKREYRFKRLVPQP